MPKTQASHISIKVQTIIFFELKEETYHVIITWQSNQCLTEDLQFSGTNGCLLNSRIHTPTLFYRREELTTQS